jgi:hypothetical protein
MALLGLSGRLIVGLAPPLFGIVAYAILRELPNGRDYAGRKFQLRREGRNPTTMPTSWAPSAARRPA